MKDISVVLTDLDGTLFHDNKTVSEYTCEIIKKAQKKGILVGISTSRAIASVSQMLGDFKPDFYICNGGALVKIYGKIIYTCQFSVAETRAMLAKIYEVAGDDVEITMDDAERYYWNRVEKKRSGDLKSTAVYNDLRNVDFPAMKICVQTCDNATAFEIASSIGRENVDIQPFSDIPWYKFSKADATKEKAIEALSQYLKIPAEKMAAFGDDFNDIGMLKLCGIGVAMENAIPQVKEVADDTTLSNEADGVAVWIESNLLK